MRRGPWTIPLLTGVLTLPLALAAGSATGSLVFFVLALSLLLAGSAGSGGEEPSRRTARGIGVLLAVATLAFTAFQFLQFWKAPA